MLWSPLSGDNKVYVSILQKLFAINNVSAVSE